MSKQSVLLLSGPNLNLLGDRTPEIYGTETLEHHVETARKTAKDHGLSLDHIQTNSEAELITAIHKARGQVGAIVINAGALTHYSWTLSDALAAYEGIVVELHLSNPAAREPHRHVSVIAPVSNGSICGFGGLGYALAIEAVARIFGDKKQKDL